jgi:hypothetical protein
MTAARLTVNECSVSTSSFLGYRQAEAYHGAVAAAGNPRDKACGQPNRWQPTATRYCRGGRKVCYRGYSIKPGKAE